MEVIAVDLFCGAGGLTRGLIDAGINVIKGVDINPKFKFTYEKNNPGAQFIAKNVTQITKEDILDKIDLNNKYLLLAGCAPCQPFSRINKNNSVEDDRRSLLLEVARVISEVKPDFIFIENVPGLASGKGKDIFKKFLTALSKMGYFNRYRIIDAKNYGVPQTRRRLILIASKHGEINFPAQTHGKESNVIPYVTVREVIQKYPRIGNGSKHEKIPNHEARGLSSKNRQRMRYIRKNGGSRDTLPAKLILKCHKNHTGHGDVYGRMDWDKVSPTLTCKCTSISNGRFGHPTQLRGISVREAAALQTFRDEYIFYETTTTNTLMVGNAVPPLLAQKMGEIFVEQIVNK